MDPLRIYSKTGKGTRTAAAKKELSANAFKVLQLIDSKTEAGSILGQLGKMSQVDFSIAIAQLENGGYIRAMQKDDWELGAEQYDYRSAMVVEEIDPDSFAEATNSNTDSKTREAEDQQLMIAAQALANAEESARKEAERAARESQAQAAQQARQRAEAAARAEAETASRLEAERIAREAAAKQEAERREREEKARIAREAAEQEQRKAEEARRLVDEAVKLAIERRAREDAERQAQAENEARAKAEAEARARTEEAARQEAARVAREAAAKQEADRLAREEAERAARAAAEQRKREEEAAQRAEAERIAQAEAERQARLAEEAHLKAEAKAREEAEKAAQREAERLAREEAKRKEQEEKEARRKAEEARKAQEEAERQAKKAEEARLKAEAKARAEAEKAAQREAERLAREEAERKAAVEKEAKRQAEAARKAKEEAERHEEARRKAEEKAREDAEKAAKLEAERLAREEAERKIREEQEARRQAEEARKIQEAAERAARQAEEARIKAAEDARAQAEKAARLEAERLAREETERKAAMEKEAKRQAEELRKAQEETERLARKEEEARRKADAAEAKRQEQEAARVRANEEKQLKAERKAREQADKRAAKFARARAKRDVTEPGKLATQAKTAALALVAILGIAIGVLHFVNLGFMAGPIERLASASIDEPVRIGGIRAALFPTPRINLSQITVGAQSDVSIGSAHAALDLTQLFDDKKSLRSLEISDMTLDAGVLSRAKRWIAASAQSGRLTVRRIQLKNITLQVPGLTLPAFDGQVTPTASGEIAASEFSSADHSLTLRFTPQSGQQQVEVEASNWQLPLGTALQFSDLQAQGVVTGTHVRFNHIEGRLYGGKVKAKGTADWASGAAMSGSFELDGVSLAQAFAGLAASPAAEGELNATGTFASRAPAAGKLADSAEIHATFKASAGKINGIDLASAAISGTRNNMTRFDTLTGELQWRDGVYRYRKLALDAGQFHARGDLDVQASQQISGNISTELAIPSRRMQSQLHLGGKVGDVWIK